MADGDQRIAKITLDERTRRAAQRRYRARARGRDLRSARGQQLRAGLGRRRAVPSPSRHRGEPAGPRYPRRRADAPLERVLLPLSPFRSIVKDYFLVCESYYNAIRTREPVADRGDRHGPARAARRRLGAAARAPGRARSSVDFDTARRLFTLLCVLHIRG